MEMGELRRIFDTKNGQLGRTLEQLSVNVYSKDLHFVLELVQNAGGWADG